MKFSIPALRSFFGLFLCSNLIISGILPGNASPQQRPSWMAGDAELLNRRLTTVAEAILPAVVSIQSRKIYSMAREGVKDPLKHLFPEDKLKDFHRNIPAVNRGSGIIITPDGYILTNRHVIADAASINITLYNGRNFEAEVVGSDSLTDVAMLKIEAQGLTPAVLGNSDSLEIGEIVMAVGNPLAFRSTITMGIVSAKGRQLGIIKDSYGVENLIQTDAAINPGNSGGALINLKGEVVGINTAIASKTGLFEGYSFAIPINL
ncbi:MAG: S1C family serine protease, partial [Fidelibacterota bacterium]